MKQEKTELWEKLKSYHIPLEKWGQGEAKDFEHLQKETETGETVLTEENGELIRNVTCVGVDVFYINGEERLRLIESHQEFPDGRIRKRPQLKSSLAEKMKKGEERMKAAIRALEEELGLKATPEEIQYIQTDENIREAQSYPGLKSKHITHRYKILLAANQYHPEGYVEDRPDIRSYWRWIKC